MSIVFELVWGEAGSYKFDAILLYMSNIVLLPPELMFTEPLESGLFFPCGHVFRESQSCDLWLYVISLFGNIFCCFTIGSILSCAMCLNDDYYMWPTARLGVSFVELAIIVIFGILDNENENYLFSDDHGLVFFIISVISMCVMCVNGFLFPNFALPDKINPRSKWGLAFSGELDELKKLSFDDVDEPLPGKSKDSPLTCATIALANHQHHVVEWLEKQGAIKHFEFVGVPITFPRDAIDSSYYAWNEYDDGEKK